ncbi:MAG: ABC transporter ATP-binding protein [Candidatus Omnitrophota bacterium]
MKSIDLNGVYKKYNKRDACLGKEDPLWALSDVSFSVEKGEVLGIIGPNGAGKSTLMRLISGISFPTRGTIGVTGKVVPLISIEGALQYVLTGNENIFLLLAAFGVKRRDKNKLSAEIAEFSGISDYLDMQITKLSSGMLSRLSFSIAAHVPSEILLIDEVLSVGDQDFQQKCFAKISQFKNEGKSMIFVSHDLNSIGDICGRVVWLDKGRIVMDGPPDGVFRGYLARYGAASKAP